MEQEKIIEQAEDVIYQNKLAEAGKRLLDSIMDDYDLDKLAEKLDEHAKDIAMTEDINLTPVISTCLYFRDLINRAAYDMGEGQFVPGKPVVVK